MRERLPDYLGSGEFDRLVGSGRLLTLPTEDAYVPGTVFDRDALLGSWESLTRDTVSEGFPAYARRARPDGCSGRSAPLLVDAAGRVRELDLSGLRFADGVAVRAPAEAAGAIASPHGNVQFRRAPPAFRRMWDVLGLAGHVAVSFEGADGA